MDDEKQGASSIRNSLSDELIRDVERLVDSAFRRNRHIIEHRLREAITGQGDPISQAEEEWEDIASLSQLRKAVGGRFENIKKKWLNAGFPLKQHRGDTHDPYSINEEGWVELSQWVHTQGFHIRRAPEEHPAVFQIQRMKIEG